MKSVAILQHEWKIYNSASAWTPDCCLLAAAVQYANDHLTCQRLWLVEQEATDVLVGRPSTSSPLRLGVLQVDRVSFWIGCCCSVWFKLKTILSHCSDASFRENHPTGKWRIVIQWMVIMRIIKNQTHPSLSVFGEFSVFVWFTIAFNKQLLVYLLHIRLYTTVMRLVRMTRYLSHQHNLRFLH